MTTSDQSPTVMVDPWIPVGFVVFREWDGRETTLDLREDKSAPLIIPAVEEMRRRLDACRIGDRYAQSLAT